MDPAVCVARARLTSPAATAAAEPLLDPPGVRSACHGLRVGPGWKVASSVVTVLPEMHAPACRSRATHWASPIARRSANADWGIVVPNRVGKSCVTMMSFTPTVIPDSKPWLPVSACPPIGTGVLQTHASWGSANRPAGVSVTRTGTSSSAEGAGRFVAPYHGCIVNLGIPSLGDRAAITANFQTEA